jgi:isoleucyl-tRNA synthetase
MLGSALTAITYSQPFRHQSLPPLPIIPSSHVTSNSGTGLVHSAPAHGAEDYDAFRTYSGSVAPKLLSTVDEDGKFTDDVPMFKERLAGLSVLDRGTAEVVSILEESGGLMKEVKIVHSYPHDWRTKKPVIVRCVIVMMVNV